MVILNKYKVTNIKKFRRFMFMAVLFISILFFASLATSKAYSKNIPQFDYIRVEKGDTLWSIALKNMGEKDVRQAIYEISKLNNIQNSVIYPGDIIKLPIDKPIY